MNADAHQKITTSHLKRGAYLYVRQSTLRQVIENTESTKRQYALRQRAVALGWPNDSVTVIDTDLGQSGASSIDREGFQKLVAEVGMGHAGIVMGLEVSRLARNSTDWHRLLEICALTDTLILDEDGVYDPSHFNDRLLLGLKGTMSEAELHVLRSRLRGGIINKARRGELRLPLPVGFVRDIAGHVVLDPDKQVQETVHQLFKSFRETGSASSTVKYLREQGLLFPTRLASGIRKNEITWGPLCLSRAARALHNPWYAGAYAYGRGRWRKKPDGRIQHDRLPQNEWIALVRDAHPAYISWDEHERIEKQLQAGTKTLGWNRHPAQPREGSALLQGRVICGLCGSRMHVRYSVRRTDKSVPNYVCVGRGRLFGDPSCQSVIGTEIDAAVGKLLVEAVTPVALELTLAIQQEIKSRLEQADSLRHRQVERAQYEVDHARHRYMQVDPANRLVADSLEADWNNKLRILDENQQEYQLQHNADRHQITEQEEKRILQLASDFPTAWSDLNTPHRERKRMLALLIEDVTLIKQRQVTVDVRFRGGAITTLTLPRPLNASQLRATHENVRQEIDRLLDEYTDAQVANILNERGLQTGTGETFDKTSVQWVRFAAKYKSLKQRLLDAGWLSCRELCTQLNINRSTLTKRRLAGRVKGHLCNDGGEWLYWPPDSLSQVSSKPSSNSALDQETTSTARGAL